MKLILLSIIAILVPQASIAASEQQTYEARIDQIEQQQCGSEPCLILNLTPTKTDQEPFTTTLYERDALNGTLPDYKAGDKVIVQTEVIEGEAQYIISEYSRRNTLMWLTLLFLGCVFLFGGKGAIRSFAGLFLSVGILFLVLIPAILQGYSPLIVAIACSIVLLCGTFIVTHGWNYKTIAALLGTSASLLCTGILAWIFSSLMHIHGTGDEEMLFLLQEYPNLQTHGILLAGIIIGTLGVLDDVSISQASAVYELRQANPSLSAGNIYKRALRIGKDHIAAAVNTLVLAYAGASLPLFLLLSSQTVFEPWSIVISREMISTEILRTLVGSIGLLAAVPLTTYIATLLPMYKGKTHSHHH